MDQSENLNNQAEQNLNRNKLLLLIIYLLNCIQALINKFRPMEEMIKREKSSNQLNTWDNIKHELVYNKNGLNSKIEHVTNFPKQEELQDMAETGDTRELTKFFFRIQKEYNMLAFEFATLVANDARDMETYIEHMSYTTNLKHAIPRQEKHLKEEEKEFAMWRAEKLEELEKIKADLKREEKKPSKQQNKTAINFAKQEITRLEENHKKELRLKEIHLKNLKREIEADKKNLPSAEKVAVARRIDHYRQMAKAQIIWDNMVAVLFNFIWLEDQWITACNTVKKPYNYEKAFSKSSVTVTENTELFISLTQGWFACATIGVLRDKYGNIDNQHQHTPENEKRALTCHDDNNRHRTGAFLRMLKPKIQVYNSTLDYLRATQQNITRYNLNAERNYDDFAKIENKPFMVKWLRQKLGMPQIAGPDDQLPNTTTTDFLLPFRIDRIEDPNINHEITEAQFQFDQKSVDLQAKNFIRQAEETAKLARANKSLALTAIHQENTIGDDISDFDLQMEILNISFKN